MRWDMFEFASDKRPPLQVIPTKHAKLRGITHYDWSLQAMTEIYYDQCIDIFPNGRDDACQFLSRRDSTYLIKFADRDTSKPKSCCKWRASEFWAPRPDVLRQMVFDRALPIDQRAIKRWILDIPMPGPFGYGIFADSGKPAAFWFPVISGWVQQQFYEFKAERPAAKVFDLPQICQVVELKSCEN